VPYRPGIKLASMWVHLPQFQFIGLQYSVIAWNTNRRMCKIKIKTMILRFNHSSKHSHRKRVNYCHNRYRTLGPELIPVYRQSACRWLLKSSPAVGCHLFTLGLGYCATLHSSPVSPLCQPGVGSDRRLRTGSPCPYTACLQSEQEPFQLFIFISPFLVVTQKF